MSNMKKDNTNCNRKRIFCIIGCIYKIHKYFIFYTDHSREVDR